MGTKNFCDICGRYQPHMRHLYGYKLCSKHYTQLKKYDKFLDDNPRTIYDRNKFKKIRNTNAYSYELYDALGYVIAIGYVDADDLERVKYIKWNLNNNGYASNRSIRSGHKAIFMHRLILNTDQFVDHINGDRLDNRKCNLRIATKSQNSMNMNYRGYDVGKHGQYYPRIKYHGKMIQLGTFYDLEECLYARWYAERIVFKEFAYPREEPQILESRKKDIQDLVLYKVQRLDIQP